VLGREDGPPPPVDLEAERRAGDFISMLIGMGGVTAVHDVSGGGVLVALARMALAGDIGVQIEPYALDEAAAAFGEGQGRYIVTTAPSRIQEAPVRMMRLGITGGDNVAKVPLAELRAANEGALPAMLKGEL
jgi:phosphoribosylformylglycinamidine synthase